MISNRIDFFPKLIRHFYQICNYFKTIAFTKMNVEYYLYLMNKQVQFLEKSEESLLKKIRGNVWWIRYLFILESNVTVGFLEKQILRKTASLFKRV